MESLSSASNSGIGDADSSPADDTEEKNTVSNCDIKQSSVSGEFSGELG